MELKFEERVIELLHAIPDISQITMCPSIFSDDIETHDCDECTAADDDIGVCYDCWERAINKAYLKDIEDDYNNYKLFGDICIKW